MSDFAPHHISPRPPNIPSNPTTKAHGQPAPPTPPTLSGAGSTGKKRKMPKAKASPLLKRAASTPQMSSVELQDSGGLSPSAIDKRRNKLGYQRISIACGHCRRRKIRCVISDNDDHGRCQNCIRLKKECVFYPVDSAGGTESRAQSKMSLGSKPSSVMSNSPSERNSGPSIDNEHEMGRFSHLASNAPPDFSSVESGSGLGISTGSQSTISSPEYGFDPTMAARQGGHPGMYPTSESLNTDAAAQSPWRFQDSPRVSDFAAFPTTSEMPATNVYPSYAYPQQSRAFAMQQPMRSMSYGNIASSMANFPPSVSATSLEYARRGSASHFPLAAPEAGSIHSTSSASEHNITPVTGDAMSPYGMYAPQWPYYPQTHQPTSMDFSRHDSLNAQWYHASHSGQGLDERSQQHHPMHPPPGSGFSKGQHNPG